MMIWVPHQKINKGFVALLLIIIYFFRAQQISGARYFNWFSCGSCHDWYLERFGPNVYYHMCCPPVICQVSKIYK